MTPLVSIGLPVYNGGMYLREVLESFVHQTYQNIEVIISDNASTDDTAEIGRAYAAKDARIRYYRNPVNAGPNANFNRVFTLATGEYFMWAAHDDNWDLDYVRACLHELHQTPTLVLVASASKVIDLATNQVFGLDLGCSTVGLGPAERYKHYLQYLHLANNLNTTRNCIFYGIYRRQALSRVMPTKNVMGGDHLLLAALSFLGDFKTLPEPLMTKRDGGSSTSFQRLARALGIRNPLLSYSPFLAREFYLQRIIFTTTELAPGTKLTLALWSAGNYLRRLGLRTIHMGRRLVRRARYRIRHVAKTI